VRVIWTLSWFDPPAEKQAAVALIEAGADVVAQHQDTPSSVQGAAANGAWAIGSESDMTQFAHDKYLTGTIWGLVSLLCTGDGDGPERHLRARRVLRRP
jgi:basic membrane protein A